MREQGGSSSSSGSSRGGGLVSTGNLVRRVCLVLDCVTPQDYCPHTADLINLQHYVITKKKLVERHALTIFYNIVSVVLSLHEVGGETSLESSYTSKYFFSPSAAHPCIFHYSYLPNCLHYPRPLPCMCLCVFSYLRRH